MIGVVVADDCPALRVGIIQTINLDPDIEVMGEAGTGPEVWDLLGRGRFDVLLLDLHMPNFDPDTEVHAMRKQHPNVQILVVTADASWESVSSLVKAQVAGYLLKHEDIDKYTEAIHDVAQGQPFFSKRILPAALGGGVTLVSLTPREKQVLIRLAVGDRSKEIARALKIRKRTVDFHVTNILRKLDVDSRAAAIAKAIEMGLISPWRIRRTQTTCEQITSQSTS
ncbi:MAG: response regulator transcription factor [Anaerolineae bacterium]|jgi:DNA-binding NarL/FixJ family response regulator